MSEQISKTQAQLDRSEGTTKALISACYAGDLERVVTLLGDGADPTATDVVGWFPLYQAACGGDSHSEDHAKVIATLIDHGVHPDQRTPNGETALMAAAYRGHAPCVAILVMRGADAHTTATDGPWAGRDCFWIAKTSVEQEVIRQDELEVVLAALKLERGAAPPQQAPPPAPVVEPPKQASCAYCGDAASRRCSRCRKVWYCSVLCQQEHYRKGHRSECWAAKGVTAAPLLKPQKPPQPPVEDDFSALPPHEAAARAGERAAQKIFDKGGSVQTAATEAGRAASLAAMARGLSIADAAAASREACAAVTGD
jgi:ankyrin repeat protein